MGVPRAWSAALAVQVRGVAAEHPLAVRLALFIAAQQNAPALNKAPKESAMPRYLVTWKANASAWPTDPKQSLAVLQGALAGGTMMRDAGAIKDIGHFTAEEGYAIFEADSAATVLGMVQPFFPYYSQQVREMVPWDAGSAAMVESAKQAANRPAM